MMPVITGDVGEGSNPYLIARVRTDDGFALTQAQIATWDFRIYDLSSATPHTDILITPQTGNVSTLLVALTTGNGWDLDSVGGNFFQRVDKALVTGGFVGMRTYAFEWTIHTTATYGDVYVTAIVGVKPRMG